MVIIFFSVVTLWLKRRGGLSDTEMSSLFCLGSGTSISICVGQQIEFINFFEICFQLRYLYFPNSSHNKLSMIYLQFYVNPEGSRHIRVC